MADSEGPPSARRPGTPEPASDAKKHASKLVVLSSVAKVPPQTEGESLLGDPIPMEPVERKPGPPPLPRKPGEEGLIRPVGWTIRPGGTTTIIKLPPKTGVLPRLTSLSPSAKKAEEVSPIHHAPPPLPVKVEEPADGEEETKRLPPIKLHAPTQAREPEESLLESVEEKAPAPAPLSIPPPLAVKKPGGAMPPPLPTSKAVNTTLKKATTVLRSKSARPLEAGAGLEATTLLAPAVATPTVVPPVESSKIEAKAPPVEPPAPDVAPRPMEVVPPVAPASPPADSALISAPNPATAPVVSRATGPVMRLPPRLKPGERTARVEAPPKIEQVSGAAFGAAGSAIAKPAAVVTPGKSLPAHAPTLPITPVARVATKSAETRKIETRPPSGKATAAAPAAASAGAKPPVADGKTASQINRAARLRKRRVIGIVSFYILLVALVPCLYYASLYFSQETRVEGQVIPPAGMVLDKEAWIVTDFRDLATGIASDLAGDRAMVMQEMQEKLAHVQRAQADVAAREARIRLLKDQIQAANDEQMALVKQAREASQEVWDGPGAQLEQAYKDKLAALAQSIGNRAKSLGIVYAPDPNFYSPEVWANAFRLGLYEAPKNVDPVKERLWLEAQMKDWRDFTKATDDKQNALREQATQLKMAPASKIADLKTQIDDLQQRIDGTISEEEPLKAELEQAQTDLAVVQAKDAGLDAKPMEKLVALPVPNKRLPLQPNGRFSWREVDKDVKYSEDEKVHVFWLFVRAYRPDGRQYWALHRISVAQNSTVLIYIEPESFISTKAILRPDLSPDEQAQ
jgi:hypothetical protein